MTPLRRQYLHIKRRYPNCIVLFRLGDFYETFEHDAEVVARELGITLTGRELGKGQRVPMAGVPYHAVEGYLAKLIQRGYHVAICEQLSDPKASQGLVDRDVVRVVTPGTVIEPGMLDERRSNYLAALVLDRGGVGLAYAELTTGEFVTSQMSDGDWQAALQAELARLQPAECLAPQGLLAASDGGEAPLRWLSQSWHTTPLSNEAFDLEAAQERLLEHFQVASLEAYGCARLPLAIRAAGALLSYVEETQRAALPLFIDLRTHYSTNTMGLDPTTRRNLELMASARTGQIEGSLLWVLDRTVTPGGARLLRQWIGQPLVELAPLVQRQQMVQVFVDRSPLRREIGELMRRCGDLERVANRAAQRAITPRELAGLRRDLGLIPEVRGLLEDSQPALAQLADRLDPCAELVELLQRGLAAEPPPNLADGGVIAQGFSSELDELRERGRGARQWVAELERRERQRTGIKSLKVGYNKVFGYYIEVSDANQRLVPEEYIRKQTLTGAERYITPELKDHETQILHGQERIEELETQLLRQLCQEVSLRRERIVATAKALSEVDVYRSLAEVAVAQRYTRPELNEGDSIKIVGGRHPVVERSLPAGAFVPNDAFLSKDESQIVILTGPNMAGKSTYIRQVALIVLMAQIGSFVPAEAATIGLVDQIFTRVGAQDEIAAGQSTFMVEMVESGYILAHATPRSLIVLDEIGRGTSTYDGVAIAQAVVEYIHNYSRLGTKTLFATHYHELTELERYLPRVRNCNVAVLEEGDRVVFLHKIIPGGADRSYGIHVAQLAGVPRAVTRRARELLERLERERQSPVPSRRGRTAPSSEVLQIPLFGYAHPVVEELSQLDIDSMTPLEAIAKLYELRRRAQNGLGPGDAR